MRKKLLPAIIITLSIFFYACFKIFIFSKPFQPFFSYLLGIDKPTTYLILLGNDTEARANGGFAGSYVKITLITPHFDFLRFRGLEFFYAMKSTLSFHDIYVPNGQLAGYVKPPEPIQQAFSHGTWELANADWDPNFPTASTTLRWFLEKGKETNPDVLGIINLSTIKKVLNILGPFPVSDKTFITPDNLYLYLQGKSELNFFPGSTQKADALHLVGTSALKKLKSLSVLKKYQIAKILYVDLKNKNIVLNSLNPDFQNFLLKENFAGEYKPSSYDNFGLVEINLGANKANAYVTRQTNHQIFLEVNQIKHNAQINFQNTSPEANPNPPLYYGGNYIAYLRLYLPKDATNIQLNHTEIATSSAGFSPEVLNNQKVSVIPGTDPESIQISSNFTEIGFWHITLAGSSSQINLSYTLPPVDPKGYTLSILKQNGFPASPQTFNLFGKTVSTELSTPFTYP